MLGDGNHRNVTLSKNQRALQVLQSKVDRGYAGKRIPYKKGHIQGRSALQRKADRGEAIVHPYEHIWRGLKWLKSIHQGHKIKTLCLNSTVWRYRGCSNAIQQSGNAYHTNMAVLNFKSLCRCFKARSTGGMLSWTLQLPTKTCAYESAAKSARSDLRYKLHSYHVLSVHWYSLDPWILG